MPEMTSTDITAMQTLIRLVSAGARKNDISNLSVDWSTVLPLAIEQHVIPLVACALLYSPKLECPDQLREYLLTVMRTESSANLIRRQRIMHLLQEMYNTGINAKVIKGYAVSECYAHPECRGSVDTDILIELDQEKKVVSFFDAYGFSVNPRAATSHHTVCQHKKYGMVELHIALYSELVKDNWLQSVQENEMVKEPAITVDGIDTLGHTDHLIFLTLHMVKHFVIEGLTLRMMLDIAIYFASHRQEIDTLRYWSILRRLHYDTLVNGILWNMIHSHGFSAEEFPGISKIQPELTTLILSDLVKGGYMGAKEQNERLESGMEYNRQLILKQTSMLQYRVRMIGWKIKSGTKYMFPSVKMLQKLYPITIRIPILMPFLWIWQLISFPIIKIHSGALKRDVRSAGSSVTKIAENRIAMFKKLGMF